MQQNAMLANKNGAQTNGMLNFRPLFVTMAHQQRINNIHDHDFTLSTVFPVSLVTQNQQQRQLTPRHSCTRIRTVSPLINNDTLKRENRHKKTHSSRFMITTIRTISQLNQTLQQQRQNTANNNNNALLINHESEFATVSPLTRNNTQKQRMRRNREAPNPKP
ncbi:hypothetical protein KC19_1G243600 [Ceratodon purpureus]|uniref:Uncharacterized protein n=1 Tax=Ceratodon purpureus TaxID=3225 RepID=A0A8T0JB58_CERPU|nr:hypothetical protein KC19_1G243600 [Ceratodon purpureus]